MVTRRYRITFQIEPRYARFVQRRALAALARRALIAERAPAGQLSIVVTDDATLRALNRRYRGRNTATDVLSFALADERFPEPAGRRHLGEIVISHPMAVRQARGERHSTHDELSHLLVHGLLHILGYDHQRPAQERRMRAREEALLGRVVH